MHLVALALQHEERFKDYECSELLDLGLNEVFYLKYPKKSNNTTVMKVLSERKARSLQAVIAYSIYLLFDKDNTNNNLTQ